MTGMPRFASINSKHHSKHHSLSHGANTRWNALGTRSPHASQQRILANFSEFQRISANFIQFILDSSNSATGASNQLQFSVKSASNQQIDSKSEHIQLIHAPVCNAVKKHSVHATVTTLVFGSRPLSRYHRHITGQHM